MKKKKKKKQIEKKKRSGASCTESVRAKWFRCAFKLHFVQLICKVSSMFNSNLELALAIIIKDREL